MFRIVVSVVLSAFASYAADPLVGVWEMNPAKSSFHGKPARSFRETITQASDGLRIRRETVNAAGKALDRTYSYVFDGKSHVAEFEADANHSHHTIRCERKAPGQIERVTDHDHGKATSVNRHTLSPDGKALTLVRSGSDDGNGKQYRDTLILERR